MEVPKPVAQSTLRVNKPSPGGYREVTIHMPVTPPKKAAPVPHAAKKPSVSGWFGKLLRFGSQDRTKAKMVGLLGESLDRICSKSFDNETAEERHVLFMIIAMSEAHLRKGGVQRELVPNAAAQAALDVAYSDDHSQRYNFREAKISSAATLLIEDLSLASKVGEALMELRGDKEKSEQYRVALDKILAERATAFSGHAKKLKR